MREQEWIQLYKMELKKEHWERCKIDNENLILQSKIQIIMAEEITKLCEEKIAEFPEEEIQEEKDVN